MKKSCLKFFVFVLLNLSFGISNSFCNDTTQSARPNTFSTDDSTILDQESSDEVEDESTPSANNDPKGGGPDISETEESSEVLDAQEIDEKNPLESESESEGRDDSESPFVKDNDLQPDPKGGGPGVEDLSSFDSIIDNRVKYGQHETTTPSEEVFPLLNPQKLANPPFIDCDENISVDPNEECRTQYGKQRQDDGKIVPSGDELLGPQYPISNEALGV